MLLLYTATPTLMKRFHRPVGLLCSPKKAAALQQKTCFSETDAYSVENCTFRMLQSHVAIWRHDLLHVYCFCDAKLRNEKRLVLFKNLRGLNLSLSSLVATAGHLAWRTQGVRSHVSARPFKLWQIRKTFYFRSLDYVTEDASVELCICIHPGKTEGFVSAVTFKVSKISFYYFT